MHKIKNTPENIIKMTMLPTDVGQALKVMIQISERLLDITERETQALVRSDNVAFSILQNEKESQSVKYAKASSEFRTRLEEFKVCDKGLLVRLENLQKELGEKTQSNKEIITRMFSSSKKHTKETLLTVQELAQKSPVSFSALTRNAERNHTETGAP
jgi:hypothetical protein